MLYTASTRQLISVTYSCQNNNNCHIPTVQQITNTIFNAMSHNIEILCSDLLSAKDFIQELIKLFIMKKYEETMVKWEQ